MNNNHIIRGTKLKNGKIEELAKRSILILEKTKKEKEKFVEERKKLYCYLVNRNNLIEWEKYLYQIEEIINEKNNMKS